MLKRIKSGSPTDAASVQIPHKVGPALLPSLTELLNSSLRQSIVPTRWKEALIRPILKKATLETT